MVRELVVVTAAMLISAGLARAAGPHLGSRWTVVGADRMAVGVLREGAPLFILQNTITGPGWKGGRLRGLARPKDGARVFSQQGVAFYENWWDKEPIPGQFNLHYELSQTASGKFCIRYTCVPDSETTFGPPKSAGERSVTIGPVLGPEPYFQGGRCTLTLADGRTVNQPLPVPTSQYEGVSALRLETAEGETTQFTFAPPLFVHCDRNELRCFSGNRTNVKAGETFVQQVLLELPHAADFEPGNRYVDTADWFALNMAQVEDFESPANWEWGTGWTGPPASTAIAR